MKFCKGAAFLSFFFFIPELDVYNLPTLIVHCFPKMRPVTIGRLEHFDIPTGVVRVQILRVDGIPHQTDDGIIFESIEQYGDDVFYV